MEKCLQAEEIQSLTKPSIEKRVYFGYGNRRRLRLNTQKKHSCAIETEAGLNLGLAWSETYYWSKEIRNRPRLSVIWKKRYFGLT